jgi:lipopolysaccharide transport system permease protein
MNQAHERVLRPNKAWFRIDLPRLWHYSDLLFLLVRRDFVSKYQQTILGPTWFVVQPLVTTLAMTLVFGKALGTPTDGIPPFLFYLSGMLSWSYFSNVLLAVGNTFGTNAAIFTKVYFPRLILPLAAVLSNLFAFAVQAASFGVIYACFVLGGHSGPAFHANALACACLPLALAQSAALAIGVGLMTSAFSSKYKDLQVIVPFLVQTWLYATPIIYPLSRLGPHARWLAVLNPMTPIVESFRLAFFGQGTLTGSYVAVSLVVTAVFLVAGVALFQRSERTFADTI